MTLTHTQKKTVKAKSGMTLIELTVVILVLLSLISILFVGARAWKRGSDRAGCIMNIRNVQQGLRSYVNMNNLLPDAVIDPAEIIGTDKFVETEPKCPAAGVYTGQASTAIPLMGVLYMTCELAAAPDNHEPASFVGW